MTGQEYRDTLSKMIQNIMRKKFPGLKKDVLASAGRECAVHVHARMYGANVDNVDSPIWQDTDRMNDKRNKPSVDASELLKEVVE